MDDRITKLEEMLAHAIQVVDDLSDIVARQENEISLLTHRLSTLIEREAEREAASGSAIHLGDQKPPHW